MPHFTLEYSANLENQANIDRLCDVIHKSAVQTGIFPLGGLRVRALRCDAYAVADKMSENAFLHVTVAIGAGRDPSVKRAAGDHIWEALCAELGPIFGTPHFALSMEWREIDPELSWKKNSIHPRLAGNKE